MYPHPSPISCFRPLAGFWFLNIGADVKTVVNENGFPSPCGVLVLKFTADEIEAIVEEIVSVPLRGSGS